MHDHSNNIHRMKIVGGHISGIQKMLERDDYCIDIIRQIQAVQSALNKVSNQILDQHLNTCVTTALQGNDQEEKERMLNEISEIFDTHSKINK